MMKSSLIRISLIFILLILFIPNHTSAELKTITREYAYQASEYDSKESCRELAVKQVTRLLLEELGVYYESHTEIVNFQLTKDQITAYSAATVSVKVMDERWDGKTFWLKAEVSADPQEAFEKVHSLRQDLQKMRELEETRKKVEELSAEIER